VQEGRRNDVVAYIIHVLKPPFELASPFRQQAERCLDMS
jgi:hypothetical protein